MLNPERVASTLGPRARSVAEAYRRLEEEGEPGLAEGARAGTVGVGIMATALKELGNELEGVSPEVQGALKRELVPLFDAGLKTLEVHSAMLDHYTFATKHKVHSTTGAWYAPWTWGDDPTTPTNENPFGAAAEAAAKSATAAGDAAARGANSAADMMETAAKVASVAMYGGVALALLWGYGKAKGRK